MGMERSMVTSTWPVLTSHSLQPLLTPGAGGGGGPPYLGHIGLPAANPHPEIPKAPPPPGLLTK